MLSFSPLLLGTQSPKEEISQGGEQVDLSNCEETSAPLMVPNVRVSKTKRRKSDTLSIEDADTYQTIKYIKKAEFETKNPQQIKNPQNNILWQHLNTAT